MEYSYEKIFVHFTECSIESELCCPQFFYVNDLIIKFNWKNLYYTIDLCHSLLVNKYIL